MTLDRLHQAVLIGSTLGISWLGMQVVHELGHVLAAWVGGETVHRVVLHPLAISRTDASLDRNPLLVIWGGPVVGVLLPLILLAGTTWLLPGLAFLPRFFAGFCLIANGVYIGIGSFEGVGDSGDLLRFGVPRWQLIGFGLLTVPAGLSVWHGLGPHFGLGDERGRVDRRAAWGALVVISIVVVVEVIVGGR
jgi:hypothetical protein